MEPKTNEAQRGPLTASIVAGVLLALYALYGFVVGQLYLPARAGIHELTGQAAVYGSAGILALGLDCLVFGIMLDRGMARRPVLLYTVTGVLTVVAAVLIGYAAFLPGFA